MWDKAELYCLVRPGPLSRGTDSGGIVRSELAESAWVFNRHRFVEVGFIHFSKTVSVISARPLSATLRRLG